jgi:Zn-dependent protease
VAHGYAAYMLGDQTARYEGRLTLNPLKHLDPFGSVILPLLLYVSQAGMLFGWAKPVPYNPYNLRPGRLSEPLVAAAGPASNIFIALIFGLILRLSIAGGYATPAFINITALVVFINIMLAIFNLVPIPPLDGSKLLFALFPRKLYEMRHFFERYGLMLVILFIFFAWRVISPIVFYLFVLITGIAP